MIRLRVKLYGLLRQKYQQKAIYDGVNGINLVFDEMPTIALLCQRLELDYAEVVYIVVNGRYSKDLNLALQDGDEVGIYPQPLMGG